MTKTEAKIRGIFGAAGIDLRPLADAVDIAMKLLFECGVAMDDIRVTKDIYPYVAQRIRERTGYYPSSRSVARRLERLENRCWDMIVNRDLVMEVLGAPIQDINSPRDIIFYLAYYIYLGTPFFVAISEEPALLF